MSSKLRATRKTEGTSGPRHSSTKWPNAGLTAAAFQRQAAAASVAVELSSPSVRSQVRQWGTAGERERESGALGTEYRWRCDGASGGTPMKYLRETEGGG